MSEREAVLQSELEASRLEVKLLREKIDALLRRLYGSKSERLDPDQLMLLEGIDSKNEAPATDEPESGATRKRKLRRKPQGPRIPEHLPVKEEVLDPDLVKADPQAWRYIGDEVSERLDHEPARFWKHRLIRRKYARKDSPYIPPVIAPLPPTLQDRCLATPSLIAQSSSANTPITNHCIARNRFMRNATAFPYHGRHCAAGPLWQPKRSNPVQTPSPAATQSSLPVNRRDADPLPEARVGKAPQGYFWVSHVPGGDVVYHWHPGRGADRLHQIIDRHFSSTLQCDGYRAYTSFQNQRAGPLELAACWAHARRKFIEAGSAIRRCATGFFATSHNSIASKPGFAGTTLAPRYALLCAHQKAHRLCSASSGPCSSSAPATCPRATWAKPSPTRWTNGPDSNCICATSHRAIEIDNKLVENKMPSARPSSA